MVENTHQKMIYLASRSPRRAELLQQIGVEYVVLPSDIDETPLLDEQSDAYVFRLAAEKAKACYENLIAQAMSIFLCLQRIPPLALMGKY